MQRSNEIARKGDCDVVYVSTAVEPQEEAGTRVPQTHEHKKRPESLGPPSSQGPGAFDGLILALHGLPPPLSSSSRDVFPEHHGAVRPNSSAGLARA
jgi:hypothetical protein